MAPKVLIFHTLDWPNAARLAVAFAAADCRVHALCRPSHPLRVVSCVDRLHRLSLFSPVNSLRAAITDARPDLIVPCDDTAVVHLHRLYQQEMSASPDSPTPLASLIRRSLGDPAAFEKLEFRSRLPVIAADANVLLPRTQVIGSLADLHAWAEETGFPAVLKTDRSWGGEGVIIVDNLQQAEAAYHAMSRRPSLMRAMKRVLLNADPNLFLRKFVHPTPTISIQQFIRGKLANTAAACWNGDMIAELSVEVVASFGEIGTSTVVRPVENKQMRKTADRLVRHLGISGFCGFDFVLEHSTGRAYLIEINPRGTQINHLMLGESQNISRDLPGALRAKIAVMPARPPVRVTTAETIAMFPQEWQRDPQSRYLTTGYHDVPTEEPALIHAFQSARTNRKQSRFSTPIQPIPSPKPMADLSDDVCTVNLQPSLSSS